jgi:hypothetical protein
MVGVDKNSLTKSQESRNEGMKQLTFLRNISLDSNYAGIIPRSIYYIFNEIVNKPKKYIKVFCSFIQLYN